MERGMRVGEDRGKLGRSLRGGKGKGGGEGGEGDIGEGECEGKGG